MNKLVVTAQVGADGILHVTVPLAPENAHKTVRLIVEPVDGADRPAAAAMDRVEWLRFIENTAGAITDPTFVRQPQGEYEQRDAWP